jgi:Phage integrase family
MTKNVIALPGGKASAAMPNVRLPYVKRYKDRIGKVRAYFRRPGFPRVALPGNPRSKEFMAAYCAAMAMVPVVPVAPKPAAVKQARIAVGTVGAAIEAYQRSADCMQLAAATAGPRRRVLFLFGEACGADLPLSKVPTAEIGELIARKPPGTGKKWLNGIRAMFDHAIASGQFKGPNPCDGLSIRLPASDWHHTWTEAQIAQFEARHPVGSPARRLFTLALFTGQRRGDLVKLGRHNIKDGNLVIRQHKTGAVVTIPIHPELARVLDASGPDITPTFILGEQGGSVCTGHVNKLFRDWCREAGLPDECVLHGLRKAICRRLVAVGMTAHQIMSITGNKTLAEVQRYCDDFAKVTAAGQAMAALAGYGAG